VLSRLDPTSVTAGFLGSPDVTPEFVVCVDHIGHSGELKRSIEAANYAWLSGRIAFAPREVIAISVPSGDQRMPRVLKCEVGRSRLMLSAQP